MRECRALRRPAWVMLAAVVVLAAAAPLLLAGCGGSSPSIMTSGVPATLFSSEQWGFSLKYPARCVQSTPAVDQKATPGLEFRLFVADPEGTVVDGKALDVFSVDVYRMTKAAGPADLKKHRKDFEAMAQEIIGKPPALQVITPFAIAAIGGRPALKVEYGYKSGATPMVVAGYLVPKRDLLYWISAQASPKTAGGSDMGMTVSSFTFD
jgi:hypothetical protein